MINKNAKFQYEKIDEYTAGIKLLGTEVKSLRDNTANLKGSFCYFKDGELWTNFHISEFKHSSFESHNPIRDKKLLLKRKQLKKLANAVEQKGLTIIPFKIFFNDNDIAKVIIWLARGKKSYEKRNKILKKDIDRQMKNLTSKM